VAVPLTESAPHDVVVDTGDVVKRVQVRFTSSQQVDLRGIHSNSSGYVVKRGPDRRLRLAECIEDTARRVLAGDMLAGATILESERPLRDPSFPGGVTERTKVAVLKTAGGQPPVGSNPTPSACCCTENR
jgi:hypothetical protein